MKRIRNLVLITAVVVILASSLAIFAFAANGDSSKETAQTETTQEATESSSEDSGFAKGMGLIAAAVVTSLAGIGGGIAVAAGAPAAIAATAEDPKSFGKSIIFVALGESIALYGVVISILILQKV